MLMKYDVYVPICGYACVSVEAKSEEEAYDLAFEEGCNTSDIVEFEMLEHVVQGNIFYGIMNDVDIIPVKE